MSTYTWKPVALHLCLLLRQQGFTLNSADNGEDETATDDTDELVENLVACDEARLYISRPFEFGGTRKLCLYLVLGNEPHETVADYTVDDKLEAALLIFEEFWSRRKTPLAEAEASWVEEVRGCFVEPDGGWQREAESWRETAVQRRKQFEKCREQRDRLAEALEELRNARWLSLPGRAGDIIEAALAAVKGGAS